MTRELIFVFHSTHAVIAGEQALLGAKIPVKVMAVPSAIRAGCGMCLRVPADALEQAIAALGDREAEIYQTQNGVYTLLQKPGPTVFTDVLGIGAGDVAAIIGGGGKTALLHRLAKENAGKRVMLSTTTRIFRPVLDCISSELQLTPDMPPPPPPPPGVCLIYGSEADGKLFGATPEALQSMLPNFDLTLLECDGSKLMPLKGWAEHEPVVPSFATVTIGVCALWPVGAALSPQNTHRPELFCALTGAEMGGNITLKHIADMISHPNGMMARAAGRRILFINQVESARDRDTAAGLIRLLPDEFRRGLAAIVAASVHNGWCDRLE